MSPDNKYCMFHLAYTIELNSCTEMLYIVLSKIIKFPLDCGSGEATAAKVCSSSCLNISPWVPLFWIYWMQFSSLCFHFIYSFSTHNSWLHLCVQGSTTSILNALRIIFDAVRRYKYLTEGACVGESFHYPVCFLICTNVPWATWNYPY